MATSLGVSAGLTLMILVTVPYLETGLFLEQMLLDSESDWNMDLQNAVQSGLKALLFLFLANLHYSYYSCSDLLRLHHISACHMGNSGLRLHQLVSVRTFIFLRKKWHSGCLTKRSVLATYNHSGGSRLIYIYLIYIPKRIEKVYFGLCVVLVTYNGFSPLVSRDLAIVFLLSHALDILRDVTPCCTFWGLDQETLWSGLSASRVFWTNVFEV